MSCAAPGKGVYKAFSFDKHTQISSPIDLSPLTLTWDRKASAVNEASLQGGRAGAGEDCCPFAFDSEPFSRELHIFRSDVLVGVYDFFSAAVDNRSNNWSLEFRGLAERMRRQIWRQARNLTLDSMAAMRLLISDAEIAGAIGLSEDAKPFDPSIDFLLEATPPERVGSVMDDLSNLMGWTEYSHDNFERVIKYGDIAYDTGVTLTEDHWTDGSPSPAIDGDTFSSIVIATNRVEPDSPDFIAASWPPVADPLSASGGPGFTPRVIADASIANAQQARAYARRLYEISSTGKVLVTGGSSRLSESFPVCIDSLHPGARFGVALDEGCLTASGDYELQRLEVEVSGLEETAVAIQLSELAAV